MIFHILSQINIIKSNHEFNPYPSVLLIYHKIILNFTFFYYLCVFHFICILISFSVLSLLSHFLTFLFLKMLQYSLTTMNYSWLPFPCMLLSIFIQIPFFLIFLFLFCSFTLPLSPYLHLPLFLDFPMPLEQPYKFQLLPVFLYSVSFNMWFFTFYWK